MEKEGNTKEGNTKEVRDEQQYGTFQGVANYPSLSSPKPAVGFPYPSPPIGIDDRSPPPPPSIPPYYTHGYQTMSGAAVFEGRAARDNHHHHHHHRLPCCGIGLGWFLFIIGFFLGALPWYAGVCILICFRIDAREKPGYIACSIAAFLAAVAIVLGVTKGADAW